jgi:hypothetical protein
VIRADERPLDAGTVILRRAVLRALHDHLVKTRVIRDRPRL